MKKALQKFTNKVVKPKDAPTRERKDESVNAKYQFEPEDCSDESDGEMDIDLHLQQRLKSKVADKDENGPTTRKEDEDLNANKLFDDVQGFKEGLRRKEQKSTQRPYVYPPHMRANGPPSQRDEEEAAAADKLFAGASKSQKPTQPLPPPESIQAIGRIEAAVKMSGQGGPCTTRQPGEDPAADAIFESRTRR